MSNKEGLQNKGISIILHKVAAIFFILAAIFPWFNVTFDFYEITFQPFGALAFLYSSLTVESFNWVLYIIDTVFIFLVVYSFMLAKNSYKMSNVAEFSFKLFLKVILYAILAIVLLLDIFPQHFGMVWFRKVDYESLAGIGDLSGNFLDLIDYASVEIGLGLIFAFLGIVCILIGQITKLSTSKFFNYEDMKIPFIGSIYYITGFFYVILLLLPWLETGDQFIPWEGSAFKQYTYSPFIGGLGFGTFQISEYIGGGFSETYLNFAVVATMIIFGFASLICSISIMKRGNKFLDNDRKIIDDTVLNTGIRAGILLITGLFVSFIVTGEPISLFASESVDFTSTTGSLNDFHFASVSTLISKLAIVLGIFSFIPLILRMGIKEETKTESTEE